MGCFSFAYASGFRDWNGFQPYGSAKAEIAASHP